MLHNLRIRNVINTVVILTIFIIITIFKSNAQVISDIPVDEKLIQIESFEIIAPSNLKMTDTVYTITKFRAKNSYEVGISIPVHYGFSLPEDTITGISYYRIVNVNKEELYEHKAAFVIRSTNVPCLMAAVRIRGYEFGPPMGYSIHDESDHYCFYYIKHYEPEKDSTSSVWDIPNSSVNFSIYPNPSSDFINISVDSETMLLTREVQIVDLLGLVVTKSTLTDGNNRIDISDLSRGTYFIKVGNKVAKFVKM